jgi:hypothetical protein
VLEGILTPRYFVLTLIYAPPGNSQAPQNASVVSYGSGSSLASEDSITHTFKDDYSVAWALTGSILTFGGDFTATNSTSRTDAVLFSKSATTTISQPGPAVDGLDHDHDAFWLLLRPKIDVKIKEHNVTWAFEPGQQPEVLKVFVGWLRNPSYAGYRHAARAKMGAA